MTSSEKASQELCQSCGLCCEGLLHSHGALMPHEVGEAAALGLDLVEGAEPGFSLPCPRFDRCCTIYEMRPNACRGFRCALLRRLDEGSVDLDDALEIVSEALKLGNEAMPHWVGKYCLPDPDIRFFAWIGGSQLGQFNLAGNAKAEQAVVELLQIRQSTPAFGTGRA